jgi:hypothetical protein
LRCGSGPARLGRPRSRPHESREHARSNADAAAKAAKDRLPSLSPIEQLARSVGNQGFSETLARDNHGGEAPGILPGGRVHPQVEQTIASRRGGGNPLPDSVASDLGPKLGDKNGFSDVRIHTDSQADAVARSVSARAFAQGNDLYFAKGEYQPGTSEGNKLLKHELAHVVQQRGAPTGGPMTVTQPGDAQESEADKIAES